MKMRDVGLCLLGGSILYVSMAACSGGSKSSGPRASGGGGTMVHEGVGGAGHGGGSGDGGLVDALTDPVPSASADPASGTRLKPKFRLAEDGAKQYLPGIWFDSQRSEDCAFATGADGKLRCLPQGTDSPYYADSSCNTPMLVLQGTCTMPAYGVKLEDAACGLDSSLMHVYAIAQPVSPSMIYGKLGTMCLAMGTPAAEFSYYALGAEIPAASFVAATLGHD